MNSIQLKFSPADKAQRFWERCAGGTSHSAVESPIARTKQKTATQRVAVFCLTIRSTDFKSRNYIKKQISPFGDFRE